MRLQAERNKHSQWKYFNWRVKNSAKIENCLETIWNVELRNTAYKTWSKSSLGLCCCAGNQKYYCFTELLLTSVFQFGHYEAWSLVPCLNKSVIWPRKTNYGYQTGMKKKQRGGNGFFFEAKMGEWTQSQTVQNNSVSLEKRIAESRRAITKKKGRRSTERDV